MGIVMQSRSGGRRWRDRGIRKEEKRREEKRREEKRIEEEGKAMEDRGGMKVLIIMRNIIRI